MKPTGNAKAKANPNAKSVSMGPSQYVDNQKLNEGGNVLFLVDPQFDFCVPPSEGKPGGALYVKGAEDDCRRIANFIRTNVDTINEIYVSLDTHMNYHIAHPLFWKRGETKKVESEETENKEDEKEVTPKPFTAITNAEIEAGKWIPVDESQLQYVKEYTKKLEAGGKFTLRIWPPHCLIGTPGHNVEGQVMEALKFWETTRIKSVHYIIKGNNSLTEHYSAFQAEVPRADDPATGFNYKLYNALMKHDKVYVAGQARDFCVRHTVQDLYNEMKGPERKRIVLLNEGMSDVDPAGEGEKWFQDMVRKTGVLKLENDGEVDIPTK